MNFYFLIYYKYVFPIPKEIIIHLLLKTETFAEIIAFFECKIQLSFYFQITNLRIIHLKENKYYEIIIGIIIVNNII